MVLSEGVGVAFERRSVQAATAIIGGSFAGLAAVKAPPVYAFGALFALLAALISINVKPRYLIALFGMLLPIWSVGTLNPNVFDMARFGVAALIISRLANEPVIDRPQLRRQFFIPMLCLGLLVTAMSFIQQDKGSFALGYTVTIGVVVAWVVIRRSDDLWPLLLGYLAGVVLSALVMILAKNGYTSLTPQTDAGYFRLTGLAPSAPRAGAQMAAGVVIAIVYFATARTTLRRLLGLATSGATMFGLLICGGRGALVGLAIAAIVAVIRGWIKFPLAIFGGAAVYLVTRQLHVAVENLNTVTRFNDADPNHQSGFSTGRLQAAETAVHEVYHDPLGLTGYNTYLNIHGISAHAPALEFATVGGLVGGVIAFVLCLRVIRLAFRRPDTQTPEAYAGSLLLCVAVASLFLEPDGPFVGLELITTLFVSVCAVTRSEVRGDLDVPVAAVAARTRV